MCHGDGSQVTFSLPLLTVCTNIFALYVNVVTLLVHRLKTGVCVFAHLIYLYDLFFVSYRKVFETGARAYNGRLGVEPPAGSRGAPCGGLGG